MIPLMTCVGEDCNGNNNDSKGKKRRAAEVEQYKLQRLGSPGGPASRSVQGGGARTKRMGRQRKENKYMTALAMHFLC